MINFTVTPAGQTLINSATAGSNPVIIDSIDLKDSVGNIVYTVTENDFYSANGKKFERIDWIDGTDRIQISCPEAGGVNPAHYLINDKNEQDNGKNDYAYLWSVNLLFEKEDWFGYYIKQWRFLDIDDKTNKVYTDEDLLEEWENRPKRL